MVLEGFLLALLGEKLDYISMTPEEQRAFNKYLEDVASDRGVLKYARDEGKKEIARNLLNAGSELDFISRVTGFSIEELKKLK